MSLDVAKLENVRELAGGIVQARCPACAEGGNDRSGEHLRIYPDGRFGCCVHPKDGDHRKRIWALAGCRKPGNFSLRLKTSPASSPVQSVKAVLTAFAARTPGTGKTNSNSSGPSSTGLADSNSGTPGTPILKSRAYAREGSPNIDTSMYMCKDLDLGVPSVPNAGLLPPLTAAGEKLPFLTAGGDLSIPFDSPERYHWWKPDGERLTVSQIMQEVKNRIQNAAII